MSDHTDCGCWFSLPEPRPEPTLADWLYGAGVHGFERMEGFKFIEHEKEAEDA